MRVRACAVVAVLSVAALAGCGGSTKTKTVTVTAKPVATRAAGTAASGTKTTVGATSAPLATRLGTVAHDPVRLSIDSLERSGTTSELTFSLTTTATDNVQIGSTFDDGVDEKVTAPGATILSAANTLDGVYLIDTADGRKYPLARDSYGQCLCDTALDSAYLTSAAPMVLSATFGAPPSYVHAVNVFIPTYGTFVNVPIS